jgi:hypothetical protein
MKELALSDWLASVLAAGGPRKQLARVRWPMHQALREIYDETGHTGERRWLGVELEFKPSPAVGQAGVGLDQALAELVQRGVLRAEGCLREARFVLDEQAAVRYRRMLMSMPAEQVTILQRAGTRWAALASTTEKNRSTAARSSASTVTSSMPNRERLPFAEGA